MREERKRGGAADEGDTFTPQINKRPSYLGTSKPNGGDSLDMLAGQRDPNDPMEQPLPGSRPQGAATPQQPPNQMSGSSFRGAPSPGSDALGNEMKKFPQQAKEQQQQPNNNRGNSNGVSQYQEDNTYVPYERQQQAIGGGAGSNKNASYNAAKEADDLFMNNLRSENGASKTNSGSKRGSSGPGWNDDVTTSGAFEVPKGAGGGSMAISGRRAVPSQRRVSSDVPNETNTAHTSSTVSNNTRPMRRGAPDWNTNTELQFGDDSSPSTSTLKKLTPRSPRIDGSDLTPPKMSKEVSQVRSRLSLLKSKMRRSESSGGARSAAAGGYDENEDGDEENSGNGYSSNAPKSAPQGRLRASFAGTGSKVSGGVTNSPRGGNVNNMGISMTASHNGTSNNYSEQSSMSMNGSGIRAAPRQANGSSAGAVASRRRVEEREPTRLDNNYIQDNNVPQQQQQQQQQKVQPRNKPTMSSSRPQYNNEYDDDGNNEYQIPSRPPPAGSSSSANNVYNSPAPPNMAADPYGESDGGGEQIACPDCGRKFNPGPFEKHVKICAKVFMQKRKTFDSTKMRIQAVVQDNPELAQILAKKQKEEKALAAKEARRNAAGGAATGTKGVAVAGGGGASKGPRAMAPPQQEEPIGAKGGAMPKWKQQSKAFRDSMRAAREITEAIEKGAPLPPPVMSAPDPSLIPCPHCGRRFNEKAGERHIPQCQNIKARPTALKRGVGGGGGINGQVVATKKGTGGKFH